MWDSCKNHQKLFLLSLRERCASGVPIQQEQHLTTFSSNRFLFLDKWVARKWSFFSSSKKHTFHSPFDILMAHFQSHEMTSAFTTYKAAIFLRRETPNFLVVAFCFEANRVAATQPEQKIMIAARKSEQSKIFLFLQRAAPESRVSHSQKLRKNISSITSIYREMIFMPRLEIRNRFLRCT